MEKVTYIIEVVPILKNAPSGALSYFASFKINAGALIKANVKNKLVLAVVLKCGSLKEKKSFLRKSRFALKPIKGVISLKFLRAEFLEAAKKIADYNCCPLGIVLYNLIDKNLLVNNDFFIDLKGGGKEKSSKIKIFFLKIRNEEKYAEFKKIIEENFFAKESIFICFQNKDLVLEFEKEAKNDFNNSVFFYSGMPKKKLSLNFRKLKENSAPILIAATPKFFPLLNSGFGSFVLNNDLHAYKTRERPYLDARKSAEIMAKEFGVGKLILSGSFLRAENFYRIQEKEISFLKKEKEILKSSKCEIEIKYLEIEGKKEQPILSRESKEIIFSQGKTIIFINRRGYGNFTVCYDCGKLFECEKCSSPLKAHLSQKEGGSILPRRGERFFLCHYCFFRNSIPDTCPNCRGHNLRLKGLGSQRIEEEIKAAVSDKKPVFRLDSDIADKKNAKNILLNFLNSEDAVLIGTEFILPLLEESGAKVQNAVVLSLDGLFNIPDFRINEKIFLMLMKLKAVTEKKIIVETALKENPVFEAFLKDDLNGFYENELKLRKMLFYPPFSVIVKITKEGKNKEIILEEVKNLENEIIDVLKKENGEGKKNSVYAFPSFIEKIKDMYRLNILLKLEKEKWPNGHQLLLDFLLSLPPNFKINVDPENLM